MHTGCLWWGLHKNWSYKLCEQPHLKVMDPKTWVGFHEWRCLACVFGLCGWREKKVMWSLQREGGLRSLWITILPAPVYVFFLQFLSASLALINLSMSLTSHGITRVLPDNHQNIGWSWDPWNTLNVLLQKHLQRLTRTLKLGTGKIRYEIFSLSVVELCLPYF